MGGLFNYYLHGICRTRALSRQLRPKQKMLSEPSLLFGIWASSWQMCSVITLECILNSTAELTAQSLHVTHADNGMDISLQVHDIFAGYGHLQTLGLRCVLYLNETPWTHEDQIFAHVEQCALSEEFLGRDAITRVSDGLDICNSTDSLEYLSATATCRLYAGRLKHDSTLHRKDSTSFKKHMFSLKPKVTFGEASEMKKQMLDRYSDDDYYFLEDYIDGMMVKSEVYVTNRS
jgi:hypothetical protein